MLSRRTFIFSSALITAGCALNRETPTALQAPPREPPIDPIQEARYAAMADEYPVAAVDLRRIDPRYLRQEVAYNSFEPAGTIVVDPENFFLYLIEAQGKAQRYGVGVGREGFGWSGTALIKRKAKWPTWTPPAEMIARDPSAAPWAKGMPGGPHNPLGARALYLYQDGRDTLYRIHGTNDPNSIGRSMSSGCVRLLNQDVIDLYERTPVGTRTVVLSSASVGNESSESFS